MKDSKMLYTPREHIPIGEAVLLPDGSHAIRIKNPRTNKYDDINLDILFSEVIKKTTAAETHIA